MLTIIDLFTLLIATTILTIAIRLLSYRIKQQDIGWIIHREIGTFQRVSRLIWNRIINDVSFSQRESEIDRDSSDQLVRQKVVR